MYCTFVYTLSFFTFKFQVNIVISVFQEYMVFNNFDKRVYCLRPKDGRFALILCNVIQVWDGANNINALFMYVWTRLDMDILYRFYYIRMYDKLFLYDLSWNGSFYYI